MSKYKFSLATERQEPSLREMARNNPVLGRISVSFEREPNFFCGANIGNKFRQVLVCNDSSDEKIIGIGMRSIFDAYINASPVSCGYLSNLRISTQYRSQTILARGYQFLHDLHRDSKTKLYLTSIISDNHYVKQILTSKRIGLPFYRDYGQYNSYLIPLSVARYRLREAGVTRAQDSDMPDVIECLQRNGKQKQFYPVYSHEDFKSENSFLKGFDSTDFFLAFRNNRIVGVMGMWDQRAFKQVIVRGYSSALGRIRPLYNRVAQFWGGIRLPEVGSNLAISYAFAIAIENNEADIFEQLLAAVCKEAERRHFDYLAVGLHNRDSLCQVVKSVRHFLYTSNLYMVHWEDGIKEFNALDNRVPYLEIATL